MADYIGDKRAGLYDATDAKASQEVKWGNFRMYLKYDKVYM